MSAAARTSARKSSPAAIGSLKNPSASSITSPWSEAFTWRTFGVSLVSQVVEFVPGERIAWNAKSKGIWAYHAWLITPTPEGCHVLTEETQYGLLARLGKLLFPKRMEGWHQRWLEGLAKESAAR